MPSGPQPRVTEQQAGSPCPTDSWLWQIAWYRIFPQTLDPSMHHDSSNKVDPAFTLHPLSDATTSYAPPLCHAFSASLVRSTYLGRGCALDGIQVPVAIWFGKCVLWSSKPLFVFFVSGRLPAPEDLGPNVFDLQALLGPRWKRTMAMRIYQLWKWLARARNQKWLLVEIKCYRTFKFDEFK